MVRLAVERGEPTESPVVREPGWLVWFRVAEADAEHRHRAPQELPPDDSEGRDGELRGVARLVEVRRKPVFDTQPLLTSQDLKAGGVVDQAVVASEATQRLGEGRG